jgi:hypothetical protein
MKERIAAIFLTTVVSSSAVAEWVAAGEGESATAYADVVTILRAGDTVTMWPLLDYKTAQRPDALKPFMSMNPSITWLTNQTLFRIDPYSAGTPSSAAPSESRCCW